ncbi:MAG: hypothetical protein K6G69_08555 [Lachnospiraceae bacterium]|nr:hypothetical protein [Lachnospiraceae bacterium]
MLAIIFGILKVIGIILLCIIGLILLFLIMILFIPVRYRAKGAYKDKIFDGRFEITYLLHIIKIVAAFENGKPDLTIRLLGIRLKLKKKPKAADGEDASKEETAADEIGDSEEAEKAKEEKEDLSHRIERLKNNIEFYIKLIKRESTKRALDVCLRRIGLILHSIFRCRGKIIIHLGLENAGTTGKILGAYKALYDYIGDTVKLYPYFDREYIEAKFDLRGRIYACVIVYNLMRIYFDKDCHRLIRLLIKKNKSNKKARPDAGKDQV